MRVGDGLSLHTVEVSGNVDPCEHLDSSFNEGVVLTSESVSPLFDFLIFFIWIHAPPLADRKCLSLCAVSQSG